jgi:peroxiredoxin
MRLPPLGFIALGLLASLPLLAQDPDPATQHGLPPGFHTLHIGDQAPDFSLLGVDGKTYSLADFRDDRFLIVIFLSNHCPTSHAAETRFIPFVAGLKGRGVGVVAINPNSVEGLSVEELGYSKYSDSYDEMKLYAKDRGFIFPYLYDGETQATARAYGCLCTPHMFIFDRERKLRYEGRFDDSEVPDPASVHATDGANARGGHPPDGLLYKVAHEEAPGRRGQRGVEQPAGLDGTGRRGRGRRAGEQPDPEAPGDQRLGHLVRALRRGVPGACLPLPEARDTRLRPDHDQRRRPE